jgi:hypothetical protein
MSNEINISLETGLTLTSKVFTFTGTQQGSDISMTEVSTGQYSGDFDVSSVPDGAYIVMVFNSDENRGFGGLYVRSGVEVSQEIFATWYDTIVGGNS